MIKCVLTDINGDVKTEFGGEKVDSVCDGEYRQGDTFRVTSDSEFIEVSFDESQAVSTVYVPEREFS